MGQCSFQNQPIGSEIVQYPRAPMGALGEPKNYVKPVVNR